MILSNVGKRWLAMPLGAGWHSVESTVPKVDISGGALPIGHFSRSF